MKYGTRWTARMLGALAVTFAMVTVAQDAKAPAVNLDSELAKQSYAAGVNVGKGISEPGMDIDLDAFIAGFKTAFKKQELAMSDEEIGMAFEALKQAMGEAHQAKMAQEGNAAKAEGDAYLAENAKKEGVKTTDSGLQYKVVKEGDGAIPTPEDTVSVHYTGRFINGEKFDSSVDRGTPATFPVTQVIPGWTEALQMMKVGSKWELVIPSDLAYGPGRQGIPPNSVLLFEVELLDIVK